MNQLWTTDRDDAVIFIKSSGVGSFSPTNFGTGFMIENWWAISAGHVVCAKDSPHQTFSFVELHIGGPGEPPTIIENPEANVACYPNGADFALIRVPTRNRGRPHLAAGAFEDLKVNHFVTVYGYGGNQPGRPLKGNAIFPSDDRLRIRTDLNAVEADSGGPVLDHDGRAVGVLVAGNQSGTTGFVPLRALQTFLQDFSIVVPPAKTVEIVHNPGPGQSPISGDQQAVPTVKGSVSIALGRNVNGSWPSPPVRQAAAGEARVLVTFQGASNYQAFTSDTGQDGFWSLTLPGGLGRSQVKYAALATAMVDLDQPPERRTYLSDPAYAETTDGPTPLNLYARSAYVRNQFNLASSKAKILRGDSIWPACAPLLQIPPPEAPNCKRSGPDMFADLQSQLAGIDALYGEAFEASAADPGDITVTTSIAATLASFRMTSNRPCGASSAMQTLFDKFSNAYLSGPLILQTLDMIVACQQLGDSTPVGLMAWRRPYETRQVASVRLIDETLDHFAAKPELLRDQRKGVIGDVATAFEAYSNNGGPITIAVSAKVIVSDESLYDVLKSFISKYVSRWCGKMVAIPDKTEIGVSRALAGLHRAAITCR